MAAPLFPPPPPPPLGTSEKFGCDSIKSQVVKNLKSLSIKGSSETWLNDCRNLVLRLSSDVKLGDGEKIYSCVSHFAPIVQEGPQCGLVCLSMASTCFTEQLSVNIVMETAKRNKCTLKGEMFSAEDMLSLGQQLLKCDGRIIEGSDRKKEIIAELLNQSLILVPYDRDCNNEPCVKNGRKSHWALLTGILFSYNYEAVQLLEGDKHKKLHLQQDKAQQNLYHIAPECMCPDYFDASLMSNVHVFAQQGKSLRTHLWSMDQLLQSNSQLTELDPDIAEHIEEYVIPEGGVARGLKDKVVCFQRITN